MIIEDEELRDIYKTSSEEHIQKIQKGLTSIKEEPDNLILWEELLRETQILKGDSKAIGVESVEMLADALEQVLRSSKNQKLHLTESLTNHLYQTVDAMSQLSLEAVSGEASNIEITNILETLTQALEIQTSEFIEIPDIPIENQLNLEDLIITTSEINDSNESNNFSEIIPLSRDIFTDKQILSINIIEDEELREIYKTSSEEHIQKLETGLLNIEKNPQDEAQWAEVLREAHSLKGDSRIVGVETVENVVHSLEDLLVSIKNQEISLTPNISDIIYQAIDAMGKLVQESVTGMASGVNLQKILDSLIQTSTPKIDNIANISPKFINNDSGIISSISELELENDIDVKPLNQNEIVTTIQDNQITPIFGQNQPYHIDTIRVQTRYLDSLMTQTGELKVTKISMAHLTEEVEELANLWDNWKAIKTSENILDNKFQSNNNNIYEETLDKIINKLKFSAQENITRLEVISDELESKIRTLRLLPLSTVLQIFPRMVRDLAKQENKEIELIIEGGDTAVDKQILEEIKDPLMHMIRNAIDHGIETPNEREKLGKPRLAKIYLKGYQRENKLIIEVTDDGRGLDIEKIKNTALKRGLYRAEELANMSNNQIQSLIFVPGFSTRNLITEVSGRGIGLDVVKINVEKLKGNISIESNLGEKTTFKIELGTSLTTANVLLVSIQGIIQALPIEYVQKTLIINQEQIFTMEGRQTIALENQAISVGYLGDLLEFTANQDISQNSLIPCVILNVEKEQFGLFIDEVIDTQDIVIKPQTKLLKRIRNVLGATILGSGEVCMILNPQELLKSLQKQTTPVSIISSTPTIKTQSKILLVEDSIATRTQEKRILESAGYEVVTAVDGLDGYKKLRNHHFDAVVSDIEMPNLNGLAFTEKIRQHSEYKDLPVILVTTLSSDEDRKRGAEVGANAYITKEKFNQDILLDTLQRLILS